MDRHLISLTQPGELTWVITKMAKEHITVTRPQIRHAVKLLKTHCRHKIYAHFRSQKYKKQ